VDRRLVGLLLLWFAIGPDARVAALSTVMPRFSNVALVLVPVLLATGTGSDRRPRDFCGY